MSISRFAMAAIATVSLMATATQADIVAKVPAEADWFDYKVKWTEGPPSYSALWRAKVVKGVVVVCGVGKFTRAGLRRETEAALRDLGFFIDDTLYLVDMSFFAKVNRSTKLVGATAYCASTGRPPPKTIKDGVSIHKATSGRGVY